MTRKMWFYNMSLQDGKQLQIGQIDWEITSIWPHSTSIDAGRLQAYVVSIYSRPGLADSVLLNSTLSELSNSKGRMSELIEWRLALTGSLTTHS